MADIKQIAIIVGIAVIFTAFIIVAIEAFYESPMYDKYCNETFAKPVPVYPEKRHYYPGEFPINETCQKVYPEQDIQKCYNEEGQPLLKSDEKGCLIFDKCDYCSKLYNQAVKKHSNISFVILALIGIIAIIFGVLFKIEFIGSGFMYGGIAVLFYATMRFLGEQNKYIRVIILFIELLIILWIGYKKLYKKKTTK